MKKMLLAALCAASMTCACATISPPSVSAINRAQAAYVRIAESAELRFRLATVTRAVAHQSLEEKSITKLASVSFRSGASSTSAAFALERGTGKPWMPSS